MTARKTRTAATPPSLKDTLSRKIRPSRTFRLPVADPAPAQDAVRHARTKMSTAHLRKDEDLIAAAETELAAAVDALEACWQPLKLMAIGGRLSELIKEHPPTDEQEAAGADWNTETFPPALIAAAAVEAGMTPEQWAEELAEDRWSLAERSELFSLALEVNTASSQDLYRRRTEVDDRLRALLPS